MTAKEYWPIWLKSKVVSVVPHLWQLDACEFAEAYHLAAQQDEDSDERGQLHTVADAERLIRKMEACSGMPAKLILLNNFMEEEALSLWSKQSKH
jgi:hypothetical protein